MTPDTSRIAAVLVKAGLLAVIGGCVAGCAGFLAGGAATTAAVASDTRTTGTVIEDQTIELKALEAFKSDPEIDTQTHLNVVSYNQIVLVTGEAPTEELRNRIIKLVSGIEKVRHVYNEVQIAAPSSVVSRSGDSLVTAKVKTKLFTLEDFNAMRAKVVTENGVVYLMGILTRAEGEVVGEVASRVGGVQKVVKLFEYRD